MENRHFKIGVIVSSLHEPCQSLMWNGIYRAAKSRNIELISFVATSQDRVDSFDMHFSVVKDFALKASLDGIILFTGTIAEYVEPGFLENFYSNLLHIPLVSLSYQIPGVPSIMPDNYTGVVHMMDHLIKRHGYKNIVFIKGPEGHSEADKRFEAYKDGLKKNNIPYNPLLVFNGTFSAKSGVRAVKELYSSALAFDAVLCVDDETAMGVISELKKRGVHIPTDVAVAGFDDIPDASIVQPSLTTVKQPLFNMGIAALEDLLAKIDGSFVEPLTILPGHPVYRRSCGCFTSSIRKSTPPRTNISKAITIEELTAVLIQKVGNILGENLKENSNNPISSSLHQLILTFGKNINELDNDNIFLNALDNFLFRISSNEYSIEAMLAVLIELQIFLNSNALPPVKLANGNTLLQQAQVFLREQEIRATQTKNIDESSFLLKIRETSQKIITTFDLERLKISILETFPALKIEQFVFAVYDTPHQLTSENFIFPEKSKIIIAYNEFGKNVLKDDDVLIDSEQLIPDLLKKSSTEDEQRGIYQLFMPLFFKKEQLGYVLFNYSENQPFFMYEELRLHIGSALKSSIMMQNLKMQSMIDELTTLYNRRGFLTLSQKMIDSAKRVGGKLLVFYADLNGLKKINDTLGHDYGDEAIVAAADILIDTFRNKDVIARMGGDEFTVIIHVGDNMEPESRILLRLHEKIEDFNRTSKKPFQLSISIGSSYFDPEKEKSLTEILKEADNRMMAKKRKYYEK
ncbi:MAG: GGDEF domain-containing protein [Deltaproteobacteria bacterium]|nr:GGDEF domain-containing protein [Deltaproteobacteria bacterium]